MARTAGELAAAEGTRARSDLAARVALDYALLVALLTVCGSILSVVDVVGGAGDGDGALVTVAEDVLEVAVFYTLLLTPAWALVEFAANGAREAMGEGRARAVTCALAAALGVGGVVLFSVDGGVEPLPIAGALAVGATFGLLARAAGGGVPARWAALVAAPLLILVAVGVVGALAAAA